jgi:AcrR family transcriptional regulator
VALARREGPGMSARGEDRKTAILDAAVARIVRLGFEGLRIRDVAQDVGINNATLHHHFPTKAALIAAIVHRFVANFAIAGGVPAGGALEDRLAAYVASKREQMRRAPATFIVLNELMVLASRDDEVRRLMSGIQDQWRDYLISVCRDAGADPEAALERADGCRRELIGMSLDLGVGGLW